MLPLLAAALFVQDAPDPPPTPPEPPAAPDMDVLLRRFSDLHDGAELLGSVELLDAAGPVLRRLAAPSPAGPLTGTLKLTAPDGTVTEYQAEFTPDPPAEPEAAPKARLGVILLNTEPDGDPPGLRVRVMKDSPAAKAGVEDGDRVISVDGEALKTLDLLRGKVKAAAETATAVRLKVVRGDNGEEADDRQPGEPKGVRIIRLKVTPEAVEGGEDAAPGGRPGVRFPEVRTFSIPAGGRSQFRFGPATVRPPGLAFRVDVESPAIRLERARVKIEAARAQVELADQLAQQAVRLAEQGETSRAEVLEARAKAAVARAALETAELDRRAAEEAAAAAAREVERKFRASGNNLYGEAAGGSREAGDPIAELRAELEKLRAEVAALKDADE